MIILEAQIWAKISLHEGETRLDVVGEGVKENVEGLHLALSVLRPRL
jgi:hypothetical protein